MKSKLSCLILSIILIVSLTLLFLPKSTEGDDSTPLNAPQTNVIVNKDGTTVSGIKSLIKAEFGANYVRYEGIAGCESGLRQFNKDGTVLRGVVNPHDIGVFQINSVIWGPTAEKLRLDIYTTEGNIEMAKYISQVQPNAWYLSEGCWDN